MSDRTAKRDSGRGAHTGSPDGGEREPDAGTAPRARGEDERPRVRLVPPVADWVQQGEPLLVGATHSAFLEPVESVWVVESGSVEIFSAPRATDGSRRRHSFTARAGDLLFGQPREAEYGMMFVPHFGTSLRRFTVVQIRAFAADPRWTESIANGVDNWIKAIATALVRTRLTKPKVDEIVVANEQLDLDRHATLSSASDVLWLEAAHGELSYLDLHEVSFTGRRLFPITRSSWVRCVDRFGVRATIATHSTESVVAKQQLWNGLDFLHQIQGLCEQQLRALDEQQARVQFDNRKKVNEAARDRGLRSLASVLEDELSTEVPDALDTDPVLTVMERVAEPLGIRISEHPLTTPEMSFADRVSAHAKASSIRVRTVALRGDWWRRDQGPLLGRLADDDTPVALLQRSARSYEAVSADGQRQPIDQHAAEELAVAAYQLYRSFEVNVVSVRSLLRFAMHGLSKELRTLLATAVGLGLLGALVPAFIGPVFDAAIPQADRFLLHQFVAGLMVAAFGTAAFKFTQAISILRVEGRVDHSVQAALWDRLLDLPSTFYRTFAAGDLADRAGGISTIRRVLAQGGVTSILASMSSVFYLGLMLWYSAKLTAVAVVLTALFMALTVALSLLALGHQRREFSLRGQVVGLVLQMVAGVSRIRLGSAENRAFRVWSEKFARQRHAAYRAGKVQNLQMVAHAGFPVISSLLLFGVAAGDAGESLTTGRFIAFSFAYGLFLGATQGFAESLLEMVRAVPTFERLQPILETAPEVDATKKLPGPLSGEIELSHVHFRYEEKSAWVIRDLNLTIRPGSFVAFVGTSGSGKSTLMRLMLGFEQPEKGSVYFDGQDLADLDLREVRQQLGVVLQHSKVVPASIYNNIVGSSQRTVEEAWEAARMAGLSEDIEQMPMGMHTYISEDGGGLSGGQRQRLLIARAVVNRPRILFMDEATSALDNRSQAIVTDSLDRLQSTRVIIAHRLSTILEADAICTIHDGAVREIGTYEELMAMNGLFAKMASRQLVDS